MGNKIGKFEIAYRKRKDLFGSIRFILLGLALPLMSFSCTSEAVDLPIKEARIEGTPVRGVLEEMHRTILGIVVGHDSLADVIRKLGSNTINKSHEIDTRPNYLCYQSEHKDNKILVVFYAGPLGSYRNVTSVVIAPATAYRVMPRGCKSSNKVNAGLASTSGFGLNQSIEVYQKILQSKPFLNSKKLYEFSYETERRVTTGNRVVTSMVTSGLFVRTNANSLVQWFEIYFVESF